MVSFLCKTWCPSQFFVFQFVVSISWIFVVCHAVKLQKVDVFNPVIGGYDKLAIAFGYTPIKELLQRLYFEKDQDKGTIGRQTYMTDTTNIMQIFICFCKEKRQNVYKLADMFGNMIKKVLFGSCDWCNNAQMEDLWPPRIAPDLQMILKEAEAFEAWNA